MRILQVMAGGANGGAERFFEDLVGAMGRAGFEQSCAIRGYPRRAAVLREIGCTPLALPFAGPLDFITPWKLRRLARSWRPQVVLGWMNRACRVLPKGPWVNVGRLGGYYNLKYYRRCDHLICNTPEIREYVVREGWPTRRAHHIPNFCTVTPGANIDRSTLQTPQNAKVLLVLARLQAVKGIDVALRALPLIPDAYLWVAGNGPLERQLKSLAVECGVQDRVRFLGWRDDRSDLLQSADVCLVPSRFEPFGNVVLNAWEHEVPLVAAASQGPKYLVRNSEDGLLVPVDDPTALADAVNQILANSDLAASLVQQGKNRVAGEFSEAEIVRRYNELFLDLSA